MNDPTSLWKLKNKLVKRSRNGENETKFFKTQEHF